MNPFKKVWTWIVAIGVAVGGVLLLLFRAKRQGERVGAAKAQNKQRLEDADEAINTARTAAQEAVKVVADPNATLEQKNAARQRAQEANKRLHDAIIASARRKK